MVARGAKGEVANSTGSGWETIGKGFLVFDRGLLDEGDRVTAKT